MLIVLSDLHFTDGTPGDHNVKADAFAHFMHDLIALARSRGAKELVFLFLGDIFDLVRSQQWLRVPLGDRPWDCAERLENPAEMSDGCRENAERILRDISSENHESIEILSGRAPGIAESLSALGIPVRHIFIPGNHDRLYNVDMRLKASIDKMLGIDPGGIEGLFPHHLESRSYGVLARHGHEFDAWNFEGWAKNRFVFDDTDYVRIPVGEVFSAEFITRVPVAIRRRLLDEGVPASVAETVYKRLLDIDNVRPVSAVIPWIYSASAHLCRMAPWSPELREAVSEFVNKATCDTFEAFMSLPYVKAWLEARDSFLNPFDQADQLQGLHMLLRMGIGVESIAAGVAALERLGFAIEGPQRRAAPHEPAVSKDDSGIHYVVYGHNHHHEVIPLSVTGGQEKVYLNSGTWRSRCIRAENGRDFVVWKLMSYLVFYRPDEDPIGFERKGHSFQAWSGTALRKTRDF